VIDQGRPAPACPNCASGSVETISLFGAQAVTSQFRCRDCGECFEALKYVGDPDPGRPP
jgi:transposase-like protein